MYTPTIGSPLRRAERLIGSCDRGVGGKGLLRLQSRGRPLRTLRSVATLLGLRASGRRSGLQATTGTRGLSTELRSIVEEMNRVSLPSASTRASRLDWQVLDDGDSLNVSVPGVTELVVAAPCEFASTCQSDRA
jgi:hypothetical protein